MTSKLYLLLISCLLILVHCSKKSTGNNDFQIPEPISGVWYLQTVDINRLMSTRTDQKVVDHLKISKTSIHAIDTTTSNLNSMTFDVFEDTFYISVSESLLFGYDELLVKLTKTDTIMEFRNSVPLSSEVYHPMVTSLQFDQTTYRLTLDSVLFYSQTNDTLLIDGQIEPVRFTIQANQENEISSRNGTIDWKLDFKGDASYSRSILSFDGITWLPVEVGTWNKTDSVLTLQFTQDTTLFTINFDITTSTFEDLTLVLTNNFCDIGTPADSLQCLENYEKVSGLEKGSLLRIFERWNYMFKKTKPVRTAAPRLKKSAGQWGPYPWGVKSKN